MTRPAGTARLPFFTRLAGTGIRHYARMWYLLQCQFAVVAAIAELACIRALGTKYCKDLFKSIIIIFSKPQLLIMIIIIIYSCTIYHWQFRALTWSLEF